MSNGPTVKQLKEELKQRHPEMVFSVGGKALVKDQLIAIRDGRMEPPTRASRGSGTSSSSSSGSGSSTGSSGGGKSGPTVKELKEMCKAKFPDMVFSIEGKTLVKAQLEDILAEKMSPPVRKSAVASS